VGCPKSHPARLVNAANACYEVRWGFGNDSLGQACQGSGSKALEMLCCTWYLLVQREATAKRNIVLLVAMRSVRVWINKIE